MSRISHRKRFSNGVWPNNDCFHRRGCTFITYYWILRHRRKAMTEGETNVNLLLQKVKNFKNLPTSFFCSRKVSSESQIFWGSLNIGQKIKRVRTDWGRKHSSQSERRGWASSILFGGQQTPADPSHSVPSGTHTKWRNEWAGKVCSTGGMVKTDEGAKMACAKIKNKQSSHWQTDGS